MKKLLQHSVYSLVILSLLAFSSGCEKSNDAFEHNHDKKPLAFDLGTVQCPQCRMPLETLTNSVQVITSDGKTYFFDDVGCMILWIQEGIEENKKVLEGLKIWVYAHDAKKWIDAKTAYYSLTDRTPMRYGFGAYEANQENLISFKDMRLRMLRGLTLKDPKIRKKLLGI